MTSPRIAYGGFFAYGGHDAADSVLITFSIPPGKRLGKHVDTLEETQYFVSGHGVLIRDSGAVPVKQGDLVVLAVGEAHDLHNTGSEDLRVIGFFSGPKVEQHWDLERWGGDTPAVTGSPS